MEQFSAWVRELDPRRLKRRDEKIGCEVNGRDFMWVVSVNHPRSTGVEVHPNFFNLYVAIDRSKPTANSGNVVIPKKASEQLI